MYGRPGHRAAGGSAVTSARGAWPLALGVTAGVAAAGLAVLVYVDPRPTVHMPEAGARPATAPAAWAAPAASVASSRPVWLRPVPPAIVLPPGDEIDEAVRPWQAGNYAGAAMWLEALAREHQEIPMLDFYAGVAW